MKEGRMSHNRLSDEADDRHGASHSRWEEAGPQGRSSARRQICLASALLVVCTVAVVAGVSLHRQASAVVLMVPPRLAALRARLQSVEDNLMGKSGRAALAAAKQAQSLQLVINNDEAVELRVKDVDASGPGFFQTLATAFMPAKPGLSRASASTSRTGPEISYASAVAAGAARGPIPLDTTWNKASEGHSAAQRLAANLARYQNGVRKMQGPHTPTVQGKKPVVHFQAPGTQRANPWSVVATHPIVHPARKVPLVHRASAPRRSVWGPRVMAAMMGKPSIKDGKELLDEGRKILDSKEKISPKGFIEVHPLLPGQTLPQGAKMLPRKEAAKLVGSHGVIKTQGLTRVMLDEPAAAEGEEGEAGAEDDAANSTNTGPPREEVGETGMTVGELKVFASAEKAKAKFLLGQAEKERDEAMAGLEDSRRMIARGWSKHEKAQSALADAEHHMSNSTMLFSTYQRELALAKSEKEGSLAKKMEEIAIKFEEDAATKHASYEEALGESPELTLTRHVMDAGNSTNATAPESDEEPAGEEAV
mmetsp:Transcript_21695/g.31789  ORF Transcript_21695/g.31789 Transcript_21695/m.31789 type:complete len:536 (-) Transcript_21695:390-1997(-)